MPKRNLFTVQSANYNRWSKYSSITMGSHDTKQYLTAVVGKHWSEIIKDYHVKLFFNWIKMLLSRVLRRNLCTLILNEKIYFWFFSIAVNLYMLGFGILYRWTNLEYVYHINRWQEFNQTHLLPVYMIFVGHFVGVILFGIIAMKFGRKTSLLCMSIPMIVSCSESMEFTQIYGRKNE